MDTEHVAVEHFWIGSGVDKATFAFERLQWPLQIWGVACVDLHEKSTLRQWPMVQRIRGAADVHVTYWLDCIHQGSDIPEVVIHNCKVT